MSTGLKFKKDGVIIDLEEVAEISRNIATDGTFPFNNLGYRGSRLALIPSQGSFLGDGIHINNFDEKNIFKTRTGTNIPPLLGKGCRPRFNIRRMDYLIPGESQFFYYFVVRTESILYIMKSASQYSGYSIYKTFSVSQFPESGIPKFLYASICGGGGGGSGGTGANQGGGGGGGGASLVYLWFPIRTISTISLSPTNSDFIFRIGYGGSGSSYGASYQAPTGETGQASIVTRNSKDIIIAYGGYGGRYPRNGPSIGGDGGSYSATSVGNEFIIKGINGTKGGKGWNGSSSHATDASGISSSMSFLNETYTHISNGGLANGAGGSWPLYRREGGGGGASYGNGGYGFTNSNLGYGGGGGGGTGGIGQANDGRSGGNGCLRLFY